MVDLLEVKLVFSSDQRQRFTILADTGRPTAAMYVDFRIKRALVVHNILNVRNIQTTCRYISTDQKRAIDLHLDCRVAKLYRLRINPLDSGFKSIKRLKSLFLLHFGVQALTFDLKEL
jgi:hypothetical protein